MRRTSAVFVAVATLMLIGACSSGGGGSGPACTTAQTVCAANCCDAGAACVDDGTGNKICAQTCTDSGQCPAAKGCCAVLTGGGAACFANETIVGQQCLCTLAAQCKSGVCGESSNTAGNPTGNRICVANDGAPYHGCNGGLTCIGGYCCINHTDDTSSNVCEEPCHNDTQCGGAKCSTLTTGDCSGSPGVCQ
ncbi:MAG: hypothetical protein ACHREM_11455 [Polyangiales bacterium]